MKPTRSGKKFQCPKSSIPQKTLILLARTLCTEQRFSIAWQMLHKVKAEMEWARDLLPEIRDSYCEVYEDITRFLDAMDATKYGG
jgi:hypothetical protein